MRGSILTGRGRGANTPSYGFCLVLGWCRGSTVDSQYPFYLTTKSLDIHELRKYNYPAHAY